MENSHLNEPKPAKWATTALPGTPEKVAVMALRWRRGEQIRHPDDPVIDWECYTPKSDTVSLKGLQESIAEKMREWKDSEE